MGCYFHQQWEGHPVGDRRVRQALNLAINREEIVKFIFAGQAKLMALYPMGSFSVAAGADPDPPRGAARGHAEVMKACMRMQNAECRMQNAECRMKNAE